ncbi:MAG: hypothetical protein K1X29_02310 [Bdellovibrionales bacterium]|nr:hypothetical protein [Bdellovibrionales bacterium]
MNFVHFYREARDLLSKKYPKAAALQVDLEYLISPHKIRLPKKILSLAQSVVEAHYQICQRESYSNLLGPSPDGNWTATHCGLHSNDGVLMAYDFHSDADHNLYLIEINTNASSFLLSDLAYLTHGKSFFVNTKSSVDLLWDSFQDEARAQNTLVKNLALVDEHIEQQKMFIEFLMYQDWFKALGWEADVLNHKDLQLGDGAIFSSSGKKIDFIYNRCTDFYLTDLDSSVLKAAYEAKLCVVSPNPQVYWLYADKNRLVQMSQTQWLENAGATSKEIETLKKVLLPTRRLSEFGTVDEVWAQRKKLFFKPQQSFGGKSVYRGSTVSRKVFERLVQEDVLVQQYVPAQNWILSGDDEPMSHWKFDLRFFVYKDQIQQVIARSYQGQITNFSSQFGGLTAVEFTDE